MKDLRVIVFPSECAFALYWMVLLMHAYCKYLLKYSFYFIGLYYRVPAGP